MVFVFFVAWGRHGNRMIKMPSNIVLSSSHSSTYPSGYVFRFESPGALPERHFVNFKEKDDAELLPDVIRIQLFGRLAALDVFIENRSNIGFGDLGIPRVVRVYHDGRSLLAGA